MRVLYSCTTLGLLFLGIGACPNGAAAQASRGNSIPVPDPTLGISSGILPLQPGWRGEAHIDRTTDPLAYAQGTLTADLRSPDGTAAIRYLAVPFHTMNLPLRLAEAMPGNPAHRRNVALIRFTSTADLLERYIVPALQIKGQPFARQSMPEDAKARARQVQNVPGPIYDQAVIAFHTPTGDIAVLGVTRGADAGASTENTTTQILICTAASGKSGAILDAQLALSSFQSTAAWQQADQRYLADWRRMIKEESDRSTKEFERENSKILAMGHENIREMQERGAARDRAFVEHEQQVSDISANFRGYLSGTSTTFKWCGAGAPLYTVDDARSPAAGYRRCD